MNVEQLSPKVRAQAMKKLADAERAKSQTRGYMALIRGGRDKPAADIQSSVAAGEKKRPSRSGHKCSIGEIHFDSETERDIYLDLSGKRPKVIAHGKIALGDNRALAPDFVEVLEVYPDGTFRARLSDAKAQWKDKKTRRRKAHVETDFAVKCDWLRKETGLRVFILTKNGTEESELPVIERGEQPPD